MKRRSKTPRTRQKRHPALPSTKELDEWKLHLPINKNAADAFMKSLFIAAKRSLRIAVIVWPADDAGAPELESMHGDFGIMHQVVLHNAKDAQRVGQAIGLFDKN